MNRIIAISALFLVLLACKNKYEKGTEIAVTVEESVADYPLPDGYPQELTLHDAKLVKDFRFGEGKTHEGELGEMHYKSFILEQLNPKYRDKIIKHYKQILNDNNWQGNWDITEDTKSGKGNFTKDNMELALKVNDAIFCLKLKVYINEP